jgi:two-component system chemotaxis sensor kinase CheA
MDEVVKEFLVESTENLDQLDRDFLALESSPGDPMRLAAIFRTIHTIKGTSGFLAFGRLEKLTHAGESLLSKLRDGALTLNAPMTSALLAMVDRVRRMLASIEAGNGEGDTAIDDMIATLLAFADGQPGAAGHDAAPADAAPAESAPAEAAPEAPAVSAAAPPPAPVAAASEPAAPVAPAAPAAAPPAAAPAAAAAAPPKAVAPAPTKAAKADDDAPESGPSLADNSVRLDVSLLDRLMNLVGELVLARNQILRLSVDSEDALLAGASQRLSMVTTELQQSVMKTRMQPIGSVWNKLPRVVRDVAMKCGKQVRVEMVGKGTDLDRTILEAIKDPLTHIVRNAVDHGLESPDARATAGKARTGTITLCAFHEGGQVNIEIADDGRGIDVEAVRDKAVQRGLVPAERAARMSDREVARFVFLPGFSTAKVISSVSGRGVGMDVVKTNVEKIGGTVDIESTFGVGTTIRIKIPLTLAIVPALIVECADERYAIPQVSLLELVRLQPEQKGRQLEHLHGVAFYRLRGNLLPLVDLRAVLGRPGAAEASHIVVLQANGQQFGLLVDAVRDTEEIVVKPLGKELKSLNAFAGATIMGDGRVALIVDVPGVAALANIMLEREMRKAQSSTSTATSAADVTTYLLFNAAGGRAMAVPLDTIDRLEEFPSSRIERVRGSPVVQYRNSILPLVDLSSVVGEGASACNIIVYSGSTGRSVGVIVDRIIDVVDRSIEAGVGTAVFDGKVTEIVDLSHMIAQVAPEYA